MHPNTKLSTSSHAQRSASDSLIPAPTHQHRYRSAMGTTPPRPSAPAHCRPAPRRRPPGSPICQLRLRRRSAATAAPWEPSHRSSRLLISPLWGSAGWYLGLLFAFCLPGYRSHVVPIQVLANRDWVALSVVSRTIIYVLTELRHLYLLSLLIFGFPSRVSLCSLRVYPGLAL